MIGLHKPMGIKSIDQRLESPFIFNAPRFAGGAVTGYWKELGRQELGSAGDTITVSSLTTHRYYQVLVYGIATGGEIGLRVRGNNNSNSVYAIRTQADGVADVTSVSQTNMFIGNGNRTGEQMAQFFVSNVLGEEKLMIDHTIRNETAGAANVPSRFEVVGKFVPSPDADITRFDIFNNGSGDFAIGSQVIVLGWVDTLTHGITDNFWKFGARKELTTAGSNIELVSFGSHEWLMVKTFIVAAGSNSNMNTQFNNDTGTNYNYRRSNNGGSDVDGGAGSTSIISSVSVPVDTGLLRTMIIRNQSDKEKLCIVHDIGAGGAGAGTAPERGEIVGKWTNTASQITTLDFTSSGQDFKIGSFAEVWFAD